MVEPHLHFNYMKYSKTNLTKNNGEKGFALLFAVLTASILLSIGLSIFNISLKELQLSTASRDSQVAFYAADSARECALYWDIRYSAFPTCIGTGCTGTNYVDNETPIICGKRPAIFLLKTPFESGQNTYTSSGIFEFSEIQESLGTTPQANFSITKVFDGADISTTLSTLGHNAEIGERRLERGILQTY